MWRVSMTLPEPILWQKAENENTSPGAYSSKAVTRPARKTKEKAARQDDISEKSLLLAERTGFEPAIRLPAYTLSKRAPSATRPSLRTFPILAKVSAFHGSVCAYSVYI